LKTVTKADLHRLVDALPTESVEAVGRWLERVAEDPMIAVLDTAPWDDEPSTPEEEAALAEARAGIARGEGIGLDEVKADLSGD
jgi:hypothetical protein